ncbi:Efflux transporter, RND family, MFP subunit [Candidatus Zixiibacteriota bacterium]|nr:Efflux transporter, RND family, MFP subunit [candidate division Zixibacteria bacterium]
MKRTKKIWFALILVVVVVVAGYFWLNKSEAKITYRTEKIDTGDIAVTISATGTLEAVTTVQVGSQVSGTISKLYADYNSKVTEGQLLAQLDPTFLEANVSQQKANLDRARAQVNESQRNYERTTQLFTKSLVSQADVDAALTDLESSKASLKQAEAALQGAEVNLRYATIKAPISGVVISRNVDVGQTVAASLSAPTLFTIANDLRKMQVEAAIDEADIGSVKIGQPVTFRVDAYPDDEFNGVVSQIRLAPNISQNVVTYTVIIDVDNPNLKLMPGMTATVTVEVDKREGVLRIPLTALKFTPPNAAALMAGEQQGDGSEAMAKEPPTGAPPPAGDSLARGMRGPRPDSGGGNWHRSRNDSAHAQGMMHNGNRAHVWVLVDGKPKMMSFVKGLQNTRYVEVMRSRLESGEEVIVGSSGGQSNNNQGNVNPFMPRFGPGGRH